ncbi:MAG: hypothetical protein Q8R02_17670 [Hyphomonadaceae bacterium]|nr:hypothetical protein [Hyphomonadaceae bacterium]
MTRSHSFPLAAILSASVLLTAGCVSFGTTSGESVAGREHMHCMGGGKNDSAAPAGPQEMAKPKCKMMDRKTDSAEPPAAHDHSDDSIPSTPQGQTPQ